VGGQSSRHSDLTLRIAGREGSHRRLDPLLLCRARHAHIHADSGLIGHHIVCGTRPGHRRRDRGALRWITKGRDLQNLMGGLNQGVIALFWFETRMGCPTSDHHFKGARPLATGLQCAPISTGLKDEDRSTGQSSLFDQ
jgi:hypothetical protein